MVKGITLGNINGCLRGAYITIEFQSRGNQRNELKKASPVKT